MVSESGRRRPGRALETAAQLTGLSVATVSGSRPAGIYLMGDAGGYLDIPSGTGQGDSGSGRCRPALLLPDSLDGARVTVQTYDGVQQQRCMRMV